MVIFNDTNLGSGIILIGLLQALGRLSEMVIIAMSLVEVTKVAGVTGVIVSKGVFWKRISWVSIRRWMPDFNSGQSARMFKQK